MNNLKNNEGREGIMAHTPGPWSIGAINSHMAISVEVEAHLIASVYLDRYTSSLMPEEQLALPDNEEAVANARLIAAAPDLLSACETALAFLTRWLPHSFYAGEVIMTLQEAHDLARPAQKEPTA